MSHLFRNYALVTTSTMRSVEILEAYPHGYYGRNIAVLGGVHKLIWNISLYNIKKYTEVKIWLRQNKILVVTMETVLAMTDYNRKLKLRNKFY